MHQLLLLSQYPQRWWTRQHIDMTAQTYLVLFASNELPPPVMSFGMLDGFSNWWLNLIMRRSLTVQRRQRCDGLRF